ncbi:hypothetical protein MTR67_023541 [Solanum verrucosum]|uniref:Reverse transcriptase zinc-binding domain-containing protein n=1 Tax=Solanum verrucosum TaxID=315347 RepID=A0AAF0TRX7_SOLVR|nr:hypothetical protein MTR67_023541 [Solanum verrucosum]
MEEYLKKFNSYRSASFTWLVIRKICLTQEVLQKKGRTLVPRCFLCNLTGETNSHLFLHCKFTIQHWELLLDITSQSWAMPEQTADLFSFFFF